MIYPTFEDLLKYQKQGKKIVLYGAGISGRIVCRILSLFGIHSDMYVDNSEDKVGKYQYGGIKCFRPADVYEKQKCLVILCVAWEKTDVLYKRAIKDGFNNFFHIRGIIDEILTVRKDLLPGILNVLEEEEVSNFITCYPTEKDQEPVISCDKRINAKNIAVYTSVFGDYDDIYSPKYFDSNMDFYYVSDEKPQNEDGYIWIDAKKYVPDEIVSPVKRNRWVKMHPHILFPQYDYSIYIDGIVEIINDISYYIHDNKTGISVFKYYNRDCLYYEALQMVNYKRVPKEEVLCQIKRYLDEGFPLHYGMTEMPVIARCHKKELCIKVMEDWWEEFNKTALRDQLSFMYVMWKNGLNLSDVSLLGTDFRKAKEYIYHNHKKDSKNVTNPDFKREDA